MSYFQDYTSTHGLSNISTSPPTTAYYQKDLVVWALTSYPYLFSKSFFHN